MKKTLLLLALITISLTGFSQAFFKTIPSQGEKGSVSMTSGPLFGQTMWAFRPTVSVIMYPVGGNEVLAGAGAAYEFLSYDPTTTLYKSVISISGLIYMGTSTTGAGFVKAGGLMFGVVNNHILLGGDYDGKAVRFDIGAGINFNNPTGKKLALRKLHRYDIR